MPNEPLDAQQPAGEFILEYVSEPRRSRDDPAPLSPDPIDDPFDEFWRAYPRKVGKNGARTRYAQLVKEGADPQAILTSARAFNEFCADTTRGKQFIRHPARWLFERPWEAGKPFVNRPRPRKVDPDPTAEDPLPAVPDDSVLQPVKPKRATIRQMSPQWTSATVPTAVYRLLGKGDVLLYVGVSSNVGERIKAHQREKPWWHLVQRVDIRTESAYGDFFADEYEACLNEFPVFNVDLVPWRCWRPSTGNKAFDRIRDRADIAGAVARLDDVGVRGRLDALRSAYRGTYMTAAEAVGPDVGSDDPGARRRLVLIAAEERFLDLDRKPPRERGPKRRPPTNVPTEGAVR